MLKSEENITQFIICAGLVNVLLQDCWLAAHFSFMFSHFWANRYSLIWGRLTNTLSEKHYHTQVKRLINMLIIHFIHFMHFVCLSMICEEYLLFCKWLFQNSTFSTCLDTLSVLFACTQIHFVSIFYQHYFPWFFPFIKNVHLSVFSFVFHNFFSYNFFSSSNSHSTTWGPVTFAQCVMCRSKLFMKYNSIILAGPTASLLHAHTIPYCQANHSSVPFFASKSLDLWL